MSRDEKELWLPDNIEYYQKPQDEHISVSEEQLIKSRQLEDDSIYYHSEDKGCQIIDQDDEHGGNDYERRKNKFCLIHNVSICRCGWQIRKHYQK